MKTTEHIGVPATLEQCAEECVGLAQACLAMARKMRGENPTSGLTPDEGFIGYLNMKAADAMESINAIVESGLLTYESIDSAVMSKKNN